MLLHAAFLVAVRVQYVVRAVRVRARDLAFVPLRFAAVARLDGCADLQLAVIVVIVRTSIGILRLFA